MDRRPWHAGHRNCRRRFYCGFSSAAGFHAGAFSRGTGEFRKYVPPKESSVGIAGELHADISHLVRLQLASAKSRFIIEALEKLAVYMKSMPVQQDDAQTIPPTNLKITSPATGPVEKQIALALNQSLGIGTPGQ